MGTGMDRPKLLKRRYFHNVLTHGFSITRFMNKNKWSNYENKALVRVFRLI